MAKPIALPLASEQPGPSMNIRFQLVFTDDNGFIQCPGFQVAPGQVVTLRTVNGATLNASTIFVADYPEQLFTSSAFAIPPGADVTVPWPIDNTAQIFAKGDTTDGLLVSIQQASIG
jgi:hypothetical protein